MGACLSSDKGHLTQVDDSVHVMISRDRKKRKESGNAATTGYKPRASNPAMDQARKVENEGEGGKMEEEKTEETADGN
eukprot:CAMPEP_0201609342 /NCGR_PEP_ID=MMETSP0492-20130828/13150_1 /ASSEMBLY_ACC=CAM_ASM_000837 /TAXON_ID=420259 /ORGANISM="Thalassiosira gravida, Strain GMp14c1" /LENGTH=77 /DNA_ID=CAMNT_0048074743 /DNA_START=112 /DNA_END=345 /DNA_ORIENTATION=+